jgi:Zn-dependent protease
MFLFTLTPTQILAWLLAFVTALTVHEAAHAYTALFLGDPTAKMAGRTTLNPGAHLDLFGTFFLLLVGFGWGRPVPVNLNNFRHPALGNIVTSLAGPLSNLIFAFVLALPANFLPENEALMTFLTTGMYVNIILAVFNLIPIPPLDGGHVVAEFLPTEGKAQFLTYGPYLLFGVIAIDIAFDTGILTTLVNLLASIVYPLINLATKF